MISNNNHKIIRFVITVVFITVGLKFLKIYFTIKISYILYKWSFLALVLHLIFSSAFGWIASCRHDWRSKGGWKFISFTCGWQRIGKWKISKVYCVSKNHCLNNQVIPFTNVIVNMKYLSMRSSMEEKIHSSEILFFFLSIGTARWKLRMLQIFVTAGTACSSSPLSSLTSREEFWRLVQTVSCNLC